VARSYLDASFDHIVPVPAGGGQSSSPVETQLSYASLLHNVGFSDPIKLAGWISGWRELMTTLDIDEVCVEHSPVALIAAGSLGLPALCVGQSFTVPPLVQPFPSFWPGLPVDRDVLEDNERTVLAALNTALDQLGLPPLDSLQAIFRSAVPGVLTYQELDHYELPRPETYLGLPEDTARGAEPSWPAGTGPRLFVYLQQSSRLNSVLDALSRSPARLLVHRGDNIDVGRAAAECDGFLSHGGPGVVSEMLLAGKPGLLLPNHHEQLLLARRVVALGAALAPEQQDVPLHVALDRLLHDAGLRAGAEAFAARYTDAPRDRIADDLVAEFLEGGR
jgi:UDP:flavonoid glycosyltransferase YjiC (YdhE family)